jgi:hypothetical protein
MLKRLEIVLSCHRPVMRRSWLIPGFLACVPAASQAQRAGIWETRTNVAGAWVGQPVRYCAPADALLHSMNLWPANCTAVRIGKTTAGIVSKGECQSGQPGTLWIIRRELSGDLSRQYRFSTESHLEQAGKPAQWTQRVETTNRFLGPCEDVARKAVPNSIKRPEGAWAILGFALVFALQLMAFVGLIFATYRGMAWLSLRLGRRAYERAVVADITVDEAGAATIPVLATFTGVRGLPWWYAIASNNAKPLLVIEPGGIRFRVVGERERRYGEIECVDVRQGRGTVNLNFTFHESLLNFTANLGAVPLAAHVLSLLPQSVPLSARALAVKAISV